MTAHEDISDALDKLAAHGSPDQIAAHLAEQGHVGVQGRPSRCPVSNYVHAATRRRANCGRYSWALVADFDTWGQVPDVVGDFIDRFDGGKYPELIKAVES